MKVRSKSSRAKSKASPKSKPSPKSRKAHNKLNPTNLLSSRTRTSKTSNSSRTRISKTSSAPSSSGSRKRTSSRQGERLSQQRQRQLVELQQQRLTQYRQHLDQQQRVLQQQTAQLQQQRRMAQYRFHEDYLERLRQQQIFLQNDRHPDYDHDPYFYTPPIYRYHRGNHYYEVNQYGADLLRQALNNGYQEGFRAGQADREDRWRPNYRDCYAYQDANYGYNGYYLDRSDYNYYFREGFRRGYEDGYNSRYQYGSYSGGSYIMLEVVLTQVLGFQSLR